MTPEHQEIIDRIRASGEALRRATLAVPPERYAEPPRAGEWSARETLVHLRNVVLMVQGLRIRRILCEADPLFADYDESAYREASLARQPEPVRDLLETIVTEHEQITRLLGTLPEAAWAHEGRHPTLGAMSVEWLARRVGEHAEEHAAQIADAARLLSRGGRA